MFFVQLRKIVFHARTVNCRRCWENKPNIVPDFLIPVISDNNLISNIFNSANHRISSFIYDSCANDIDEFDYL